MNKKIAKNNWYVCDLKNKSLGRSLTRIAHILLGKNQANYSKSSDSLAHIVIINASKIKVSSDKLDTKKYYRHSGYLGNLKSEAMSSLIKKNPEMVVLHAIKGMLPKNKLGSKLISRVKIYPDEAHPHHNVVFKEINGND